MVIYRDNSLHRATANRIEWNIVEARRGSRESMITRVCINEV
jgi:hypothetical protein